MSNALTKIQRLTLPTRPAPPAPPVWRVKHTDQSGTRRELLVPARSNALAMDHVEAQLGPSVGGSCINTYTTTVGAQHA